MREKFEGSMPTQEQNQEKNLDRYREALCDTGKQIYNRVEKNIENMYATSKAGPMFQEEETRQWGREIESHVINCKDCAKGINKAGPEVQKIASSKHSELANDIIAELKERNLKRE